MSSGLRQTFVIARRDFLSIVATPTFLLFLLAPLFMLGFGLVGGLGASALDGDGSDNIVIAVVSPADAALLHAADAQMHRDYPGKSGIYRLETVVAGANPEKQARILAKKDDKNVYSALFGTLERPVIIEQNEGGLSGRYLASLAEMAVRAKADGSMRPLVQPEYQDLGSGANVGVTRKALGFGATFIIFMLTLLTAGQTVSTLAEEKANKVIEILAAAAPLESIFAGKVVAMLGVAVLFISFWLVVGIAGSLAAVAIFADQASLAATSAAGSAGAFNLADFAPAIGFPAFLGLGVIYFLLAFLLLGSVFLGIGALASSMREIQMLSLPITIFQVAMFGLGSAAANNPGTTLATVAQIIPFSSPFAMAARGATDPAIWPHLIAIVWQGLWVALVLWLAVKLFRFGVLKSGPGWRLFRKRTR
ncbi:ABC transporter permease [Sphingorhabdus soli]|uniref:ABC transporter permease n=1 Tax=Flavisphingopyxis soli TaxID=2601267 RepID=A0A5C6UKA2_9SPHN|nr:ABC transporter permease [Sphingorhabdus soli]TXC73483.1 ABC transporter permease [Sphingorhabdus soli]